MREFVGIVKHKKGNVLSVEEAEVNDLNSSLKPAINGCHLKLKQADQVLNLSLGENCDQDLLRASSASKQ